MSLIEKAMDKLAGREPDAAEDVTQADAGARTAPGETATAPATAAAAPPADAPAAATPATAPPPLEAAPAAPTAPTAAPEEIPDGRYTHIDFERLHANGNLTPGTDLVREAEEYQYIKRRLLGNIALGAGHGGRPANLIMLTSSVPGEGKTFTSINLSMSITVERDHTLLVIDTDIMKRDLSRQLGLEGLPGLFDYLDGDVDDIANVIYRTNVPNMAVIPSGRFKAASTELLASARMQQLVDEIASRYRDRVVLFDTPPLLATSTAVALAPLVGQLVLVVEAGETRTTTVLDAIRILDRVPVTGVIFNKSKGTAMKPYDYYGNYYIKPTPAS
ncbi:MAG: AAA family ATPase [Gammaproteobacteria bacterium]